jgi:hypothetical protein
MAPGHGPPLADIPSLGFVRGETYVLFNEYDGRGFGFYGLRHRLFQKIEELAPGRKARRRDSGSRG